MFDRHFHSRHVNTTVNVDQQPHDAADAARLFGEIKKEAEKAAESSIRLKDNGFESQIQIHRNAMDLDTTTHIHFSLNGKKMKVEHRDHIIERGDLDDYIKDMIDKVSHEITATLLDSAFRQNPLVFEELTRAARL